MKALADERQALNDREDAVIDEFIRSNSDMSMVGHKVKVTTSKGEVVAYLGGYELFASHHITPILYKMKVNGEQSHARVRIYSEIIKIEIADE